MRRMSCADHDRYEKWMSGDAQAGVDLVLAYHEYLVSWIARRVESPHTAHDIAQDVWVQVMRGSYQGRGAFRIWLLRVARTGVVRYYRRSSCRVFPPGPETRSSPTRNVLRSEVVGALEELTNSDQRAACRLWFLDDMPIEEISRSTNTNPKTVRSRLRLGVEKLRKRIARAA